MRSSGLGRISDRAPQARMACSTVSSARCSTTWRTRLPAICASCRRPVVPQLAPRGAARGAPSRRGSTCGRRAAARRDRPSCPGWSGTPARTRRPPRRRRGSSPRSAGAKAVCQSSARYWPGSPMRFSSGMKVRWKRTRCETVARMPIGSHHEPSTSTLGSARSQASISSVSGERGVAGAARAGGVDQQDRPVARRRRWWQNTLVPSTIQPPSTGVRVVPKRDVSPGARACGSPLQTTHFSPRSTTPRNQRRFCSSSRHGVEQHQRVGVPLPAAGQGQVGLGDLLGHHPEREGVAAQGAEARGRRARREPSARAGRRRTGRRSLRRETWPSGRTGRRAARSSRGPDLGRGRRDSSWEGSLPVPQMLARPHLRASGPPGASNKGPRRAGRHAPPRHHPELAAGLHQQHLAAVDGHAPALPGRRHQRRWRGTVDAAPPPRRPARSSATGNGLSEVRGVACTTRKKSLASETPASGTNGRPSRRAA